MELALDCADGVELEFGLEIKLLFNLEKKNLFADAVLSAACSHADSVGPHLIGPFPV
jgi:hypothetical protein